MKQIIAYQCEFCNKITKKKQSIKRHELICWRNPELKSCENCENCTDGTSDYFCKEFNINSGERPWFINCETKYNCGKETYIPFTCKKFIAKQFEYEEEGE